MSLYSASALDPEGARILTKDSSFVHARDAIIADAFKRQLPPLLWATNHTLIIAMTEDAKNVFVPLVIRYQIIVSEG